jgi:outer membrane lipoprotein-sorting protein
MIEIRARRRLIWAVPAAVAVAVAGGVTVATVSASASAPVLPTKSPRQLLSAVAAAKATALSGVVRESADLGLPSLPGVADSASLSWQSFVAGSHRAKVWVDGGARQRVALLGQLSEADVIHNGRDLWTYTSRTNTVTHTTLAARSANRAPTGADVTPSQLAERILAAVMPTTDVSVSTTARVAGRDAYTLRLGPKSLDSTVSSVRIAVDAATFVPLRVQVFGSSSSPALEIGFRSVSFRTPAASIFDFHSPKGATVGTNPFGSVPRTHRAHSMPHGTGSAERAVGKPKVIGKSWTTVLEIPGGAKLLDAAGGLAGQLTTPVGSSGQRLLRTALINVLTRPDGTAFVGAVTPAYLEHIAATTG